MDPIDSNNKSLTETHDMTDKDKLTKMIAKTIEENNALYAVIEETKLKNEEAWKTKSIEEKVEELKSNLLDQNHMLRKPEYGIHYRDVARIIKEFHEIRDRIGALEGEVQDIKKGIIG